MRRFVILAFLLPFAAVGASPQDEAAALIARGQFLAAERIIEPLVKAKNVDARTLYQFSQVRLGQQQTAEAIELVKRAIKLDSTKAEYFSLLGLAYSQQREDNPGALVADKIHKAMEQSVKLDPNHVPGLLGLSRSYSTAAPGAHLSYKKAREYATRAAAADPFQGEIELGHLDMLVRETGSALAHYEKAIATKPSDPLGYVSAAGALLQLGRTAEAKARLQEALKLKPDFPDAVEALKAIDTMPAPKPGN